MLSAHPIMLTDMKNYLTLVLKNKKAIKVGVKTKRQKAGWDNG
ncbi:hypothetical protein [Xenorhabdus koppenhoeferi]|nr:hypothetical protein [Xenorhabdus sp. Vera]